MIRSLRKGNNIMENGAEFYFRFLDGDKEGMTDLIREYKDGLSLYINSFVKNICQAEELMEETFVSLVMKKPKYSGKSSFKTWLYAIGRNIAFDYIRKSKRHRNDLPIDELYEMSDEENIENSYIQEEQKKTLYHALSKLHPDYSQVLHLTYLEGFTNSETACIMHKTNRQIENLIYRAKKALRDELEKEGFVYEGL